MRKRRAGLGPQEEGFGRRGGRYVGRFVQPQKSRFAVGEVRAMSCEEEREMGREVRATSRLGLYRSRDGREVRGGRWRGGRWGGSGYHTLRLHVPI